MFDYASIWRTGNKYADQYIVAAEELGLETEIIDRTNGTALLSYNGRQMTIRAAQIGCNNFVATQIAQNKYLTSKLLERKGFRVPECRLFIPTEFYDETEFRKAIYAWATGRFPVVLKTATGLGGHNVFAGIDDHDELEWAIRKLWNDRTLEILCEKHIFGQHYRIKMFDYLPTAIYLRIPGHVIGDGTSSISELIQFKNQEKSQSGLPLMEISDRMLRLLEKNKLDLGNILGSGVRQELCIESNLHLGGHCDQLPVSILSNRSVNFFSSVARATQLRYVGLDIIVDDLADPQAHERAYVNETNAAAVPNEYTPGEDLLQPTKNVLCDYFSL